MSGLATIWVVPLRRRWLVLATMVGAMVLAMGISFFIKPTYRACSKAIVSETHINHAAWSGIEMASGEAGGIAAYQHRPVDEILAVSGPYIDDMVFKLQLRDTNGYLMDNEKLTANGMLSTIKRRLSPKPSVRINQHEGTDVIEIVATSADARQCMIMANTLAEGIVDKNRTETRARFEEARRFLAEKMEKAKGDISSDLRRIVDLTNRHESVDIDTEARLAAEKMKTLLAQKEDAVIALAQAKAKLGLVNTELGKQRRGFLSPATMRGNPHIESLKEQLTALRLELAKDTSELTEEHPRVVSLKDQLAAAEVELEKEISVYRLSAPERTDLESHVAALKARLEVLDGNIDDHERTLSALSDRTVAQATFDMNLEAIPKYYSGLLDSLYRLGVIEAGSLSAMRVVEPAKRPLAPVFPSMTLNCILGMLLGLAAGLGLAFLKERSDDTIRSAEDVKMLSSAALVGAVPRLNAERALISGVDPNDPLYESYRWMRRQIGLAGRMHDGPWRTLLVTSAGPGEGKSTTVANLGIAMAREGKNVVLVDADLRRPSLASCFGLSNEQGLTDCLRDTASLDDAIQRTHIPNLSLIPSGQPFADPGALLETDGMKRLVQQLQSRYDMVILDSAPLLVKTDALSLARYAYGSVIVLESERTTRHAVFEMVDLLSRTHVEPLGFVLNKYRARQGKGLYSQYYASYESRQLPQNIAAVPQRPPDEVVPL